MALGDAEKAYMDAAIAHHRQGIKLAENYLGNSDAATRPAAATRMAASAMQDHSYQIDNLNQMMDDMSNTGRSADRAANIILGRGDY